MALRNKAQVSYGSFREADSGSIAAATGAAIAGSGTNSYPLDVSGFDQLTVIGRMTAAAVGDVTPSVNPYEPDGSTVNLVTMNITGLTAVFAGGVVYFFFSVTLRGVPKLQVNIKNNNAGAQTIQKVDYFRET